MVVLTGQKRDLAFHFIDFQSKDQTFSRSGSKLSEEKIGFLIKTVTFVVHIFQSHASIGGKERYVRD